MVKSDAQNLGYLRSYYSLSPAIELNPPHPSFFFHVGWVSRPGKPPPIRIGQPVKGKYPMVVPCREWFEGQYEVHTHRV